ncbi:MAG: hypothetical protein CBB68_14740 [Rhodospirillaceae bacterium TMED8]|mgnify:CR=1 FL=1|nr:hypothetical protein [Magnetovibrio sp.]OUT47689.1 MAG: hypothetical protein CBB68_14740 [Rhodospirillaceae bacterium TMED8]|tara:strand:+ start:2393 stop:3061 length:669 start_codon:yes stop_codon:yes gene_type:complete
MVIYSRDNPSSRYCELIGYYQEMHAKGVISQNIPVEKTFDGLSILKHVVHIQRIINILGSQTILDYGAGKGKQYEPSDIETGDGRIFPDIQTFWNVVSITCFDPAYKPFNDVPQCVFDGVVTTDVLEHCPRDDIPWIVDEIFRYATDFVYISVACYPATKTLPNGENAHCTLEPPEWWDSIFKKCVRKTPGLRYYTAYDVSKKQLDGTNEITTIMGHGRWDK